MKLTMAGIKNLSAWEEKGFSVPRFDLQKVAENTRKNPAWLHFGAGNIFRAFPARAQQELLNQGLTDTGIIVCECFDEEIIHKAYTPFDQLSLAITLKADESIEKMLVASVTATLTGSADRAELARIFTAPSLQMASFTITEKGYAVCDAAGAFLPFMKADAEGIPADAKTLMGMITYLCLLRFEAGKLPLALLSMDNCARNGDKLKAAVLAIAKAWAAKGSVSSDFVAYLQDPAKIAFPISMIDKITPRPSDKVKALLEADGCENMDVICTAKNTYTAAFVNAEETEYLIIENLFPNGRPPLEKAGMIFTDRETVDNVEKMKVGACLNPLHTILAVYGCLLGYTFIYDEMKNPALVSLIKQAGYIEAMPFVPDPGIIHPKDFIDQVIEKRLPNPFIPDAPQRIACDTSQKIPVRFGGTLKEMERQGKDLSKLTAIPFFFAGWLRYLTGINDEGNAFTPSPDPMLAELQAYVKDIKLGDKGPFSDILRPILSNQAIFGVDLYQHGLADKVEATFTELISKPGAVLETLERYY